MDQQASQMLVVAFAEARQDMFDYIEMFCNPKRKHVRNGMLSPVSFERQQKPRREGV
jgi:putative transposase